MSLTSVVLDSGCPWVSQVGAGTKPVAADGGWTGILRGAEIAPQGAPWGRQGACAGPGSSGMTVK